MVRLQTPTHALGVAASEDILHITYDDSPTEFPNQGGLSARWTRYSRDLSLTNSGSTQSVSFARPTQEDPHAEWNGGYWMLRWFERDRQSASAEGAHGPPEREVRGRRVPPGDSDAGSFAGRGIGRWSSPWTAWSRSGFMGARVHDGRLLLLALTSEPAEMSGSSALVAWSMDAGELHAAHRASLDLGGDRELPIVATGLRDATAPSLALAALRGRRRARARRTGAPA